MLKIKAQRPHPTGPLGSPAEPAMPGESNYPLFDQYTVLHVGVGALYGMLGLSAKQAAMLSVAWEVVERPLKDAVPSLFPSGTQDSLQNSVGDVAANMIGWWAANRHLRA